LFFATPSDSPAILFSATTFGYTSIRGGSWDNYANYCAVAGRYDYNVPGLSGYNLGFRPARSLGN
jgi:formylglycine-generating enzyme required for sulfatase activity